DLNDEHIAGVKVKALSAKSWIKHWHQNPVRLRDSGVSRSCFFATASVPRLEESPHLLNNVDSQ
ncbi:hypothetical protein HAX54_026541, partial [Datura stramonium]|nr:hypothetical protein [Datura stramonium]